MDWVLTFIALGTTLLAGMEYRFVWEIAIIGQIPWLWYAWTSHQPGFIFCSIAFVVIYLFNRWKWKKDGIGRKNDK